ncbi:MAG: Na+/H+ antiporter subunit E [Limisphaerales bacterium]
MKALGLNLLIAVIWLLLSPDPSPAVFAIGFLIGFGLVAAFRSLVGGRAYVRRCFAFLAFLWIFTREFLVANATVAWMALFRPRESIHPNFITYDVTGMTPTEILLLSYCITLTPGTTSVDISADFKTLILHALEADNPDAIRAGIDGSLKRGILSFTR